MEECGQLLERSMYGPIINGLAADGWLAWRIADGSYGKKPFDICGVSPTGLAVGIEAKVCGARSACFPERQFEPHQISWLKAYDEKGAYGFAVVQFSSLGFVSVFRHSGEEVGRLRGRSIYVGWNEIALAYMTLRIVR